ncbi:hypothetical protein [Defluviimonas sp. SAOS-178_SWC]|uniref:hypothetical protein n=1 Tax=Defluviimonas sp. SAOS-178_SWC TaxID=3121287 RepID=UPI00322206F1
MTIANWLAVFVPFIGLVGGAIVYMVQKGVDRQNQIRSERRELYRKLVVDFNNVNVSILRSGRSADGLDKLVQYKNTEAEILVCAPDPVISALEGLSPKISIFAKHSNSEKAEKDAAFNDLKESYEAAVAAMRKDVLGDTEVTKRVVQKFAEGFWLSVGRFPL